MRLLRRLVGGAPIAHEAPLALALLALVIVGALSAACSSSDTDDEFTYLDADLDGIDDAADIDDDNDGVLDDGAADGEPAYSPCVGGLVANCDDNCRRRVNPAQDDGDADGLGDVCDTCPTDPAVHPGLVDCNGDGDTIDPGEESGAHCDQDDDGDGDACDNCPLVYNPLQANTHGLPDAEGDACDDTDMDGIVDLIDRCVNDADSHAVATDCNADADTTDSGEAAGGQCDQDIDGVGDACDNCDLVSNASQADSDGNGVGDACQVDDDSDGVLDDGDGNAAVFTPCPNGVTTGCDDNCPVIPNGTQADADGDLRGDACDTCPANANANATNTDCNADGDTSDPGETKWAECNVDGDTKGDVCDNCPATANDAQLNVDGDALGDDCDGCMTIPDTHPVATDCNGDGDMTDVNAGELAGGQCDRDQDAVPDACDNCPAVLNPAQANADLDACGDDCDPTPLVTGC